MADAGLTNGAFYAHFRSKDDLIASVVEEELRLQAAWVDALPTGRAGVEQLVRAYIAPEHRDYPDAGCPSAALLDELGRSDVVTNGRRPGSRRARHSQPAGGCAVCMSIAIQWFAGRGWDCR
jgi:AcrR family transcriptional regulator